MGKLITVAIVGFVLGGSATGVLLARAQPVAPSPAGGWMTRGPEMGPWGDRMGERRAHHMERMRRFALVYRAEDRKLTPPDVQKIAEAFLLWNGNHTWKVANVAADGDAIGFDLATPEGSVIARYTMDPKTAHVTRRG